jgi:cytochrome P450
VSTETPPRYPFAWNPPMQMPEALKNVHESSAMEVTLPSGDTATMVTRYQDVRALFADKRLSRNIARPDCARISKDNDLFMDPHIDPDPPKHTQVRSLVTKAFTARRIESLRPYVQEVADELLDKMAAGPRPAELNEAFAFPLPIMVICKLLGVPADDRDQFRGYVDGFLAVTKLPPEEIGKARQNLWKYLGDLIEEKRKNPADDLISEFIRVRDEDDNRMNEHELHFWCQGLLIAGYVTTASQIGTGTAVLLHRPDLVRGSRPTGRWSPPPSRSCCAPRSWVRRWAPCATRSRTSRCPTARSSRRAPVFSSPRRARTATARSSRTPSSSTSGARRTIT